MGVGLLARKRLFEVEGLFDTTLRAAEDWDMWLRLAASHDFDNLPEPLTNISLHGTGTFRNAVLMEENQWRVYHKALERWPELLDWRTRREMRALILGDAGGEYVQLGQLNNAIKRYGAALLQWPFKLKRWRATALTLARIIVPARRRD